MRKNHLNANTYVSSVTKFLYFHTLCMRTKDLARLRIYAGSSEHLLPVDAIRTKISCTVPLHYLCRVFFFNGYTFSNGLYPLTPFIDLLVLCPQVNRRNRRCFCWFLHTVCGDCFNHCPVSTEIHEWLLLESPYARDDCRPASR